MLLVQLVLFFFAIVFAVGLALVAFGKAQELVGARFPRAYRFIARNWLYAALAVWLALFGAGYFTFLLVL